MIKFNKDKYIQIATKQGHAAAITELHRDIESWEYKTFEDTSGYQPEMLKDLIEIRNFSRELWDMAAQS